MLKVSGLLAAGALLLSVGSMGASALPPNGARIGAPATTVDLVQYGSSRCFNRCISGRIYRRCQNDPEARKESCCSVACNWYY